MIFRSGVRLRSKASGKPAQHPVMSLANTPPGVRPSSPRETIPFLASSDQVGLPAVAASDALLRRSMNTYQSGEVAFGVCGADGRVFGRVVGQHSRARGQTGTETVVTQRAEVGFCPRCSSVTHIAIPGSYSLGAQYPQKDVAMQLRQAFGPWGLRMYSAFQYVAENGYLPKDWDWAAPTLTGRSPLLLYFVSSSMGGICDLISGGAPPLHRAAGLCRRAVGAPPHADLL